MWGGFFLEQRFNTQPPEGGWGDDLPDGLNHVRFQHTAARRRLVKSTHEAIIELLVSTHSRPKAAGRQIVCKRTDG